MSSRGEVMPVYDPLPTQLKWHKSSAPVTFLIGGVGSGKTLALCHEALKMARINAGLPGLVSAPTYMMLRDIDIETFFTKVCPREKVDFNKQEYKATFPNGSNIFFRSLDNPDRIRGLEAAWGLIDEAPHCTEYGFDVLLGRVRHPAAKLCQVKCIGNPAGFNWVHNRCVENAKKYNYRLLRTTTFDNPYLSKQYLETLQGSYSEKFADQELRGEFISLEGLVYPFSRQLHVVEKLAEKVAQAAPDALLYAGLDFGWTDPTVLLDIRVHEYTRDGKRKTEVYVVDEFYETQVTADKLAARIKAKPYEWIGHDPAGKQARQEAEGKNMIRMLKARGCSNFRTTHKPRIGGIRIVSGYFQNDLGEVRLYIDKKCVNLIRELSSYSWQVTPEGRANKEAPQEHNDHACDALRYFFINKFQESPARFEV